MTLQEYIEMAKRELDEMQEMWISANKVDPDGWPLELSVSEWGEQELAERFS